MKKIYSEIMEIIIEEINRKVILIVVHEDHYDVACLGFIQNEA